MFKQARRKKQQKQFASLKNSTTLAEMDEELWQDESEENGMLKKGPWTAAEDAILIAYVNKHGEGNWNSVQKYSGLSRCGKSCRLRWANHLRPNLKKDAFSIDEERLIINLHAKLGNKWARMATQLPGRTDNEIKNYWNTRIKRRIRAGLPVYPLDPRVDSSEEKITSGSPITLLNSSSPGSSNNSTNESSRHLKCTKFRPPPFQYDCVAFPISTSSPYLRIDQSYLSSQPKPVENTSFIANPHNIQYESSKSKDVLSSNNIGLLDDVRSMELQQNNKENMDKFLDDTTNSEIKIQEYTTLSSESTSAEESIAMASNGSYTDEEELSTLLDFTRQESASLTGLCITNSETQMSYTALGDALCNSDIVTNNNILENNVLSSQVWDTHISDFKSWFFNDQMHDSFAIF